MTFNVGDAAEPAGSDSAGIGRGKGKRRIFIVEDSERLASLLKAFLESRDYEIIVEPDGSQAVPRFLTERPDLVVLDLMLPGKDGFQICRELRAIGNTPILVFTARNDDIDHVLGLELGADDYVVKPLEPRVLLARIEALWRRAEREGKSARLSQVLRIGPFVITRSARSATYRGAAIDLTAADFNYMATPLTGKRAETRVNAGLRLGQGVKVRARDRRSGWTVCQPDRHGLNRQEA